MRISEILTEQELEEIDRRGFLKGMGAAAVGAIAFGNPAKVLAQVQQQYSLTDEDTEVVIAVASLVYFPMVGYNNGGLQGPALDVLRDLDEVLGFLPKGLYSNKATIMQWFDDMSSKNPNFYKACEKFNMPQNRPLAVRYINRILRIVDKIVQSSSPDKQAQFANKVGNTVGMQQRR
jgi:hypothetical protein